MLIMSAAHAATVDAAPRSRGHQTYNYATVAHDQMSRREAGIFL
jgi:hypothetical protein